MVRLVDLTQPWGPATAPWIGFASPQVRVVGRFPADRRYSTEVQTAMHCGTHIDAPRHFSPTGLDMASVPLDTLCAEGVVVDVSDRVGEWGVIEPEHLTEAAEVRPGDIVIVHTGWHRHAPYGSEPDEERYVCRHPGGALRLAQWIVDMRLRWIGFDVPGADHPLNADRVRALRPDLVAEWEARTGRRLTEVFPEGTVGVMHTLPFRHNITHAENLGGDIAQVLGRRLRVGAFPWRFIGGDASICRVVAFVEEP